MRQIRPDHWLGTDWEAKAKENPLLAIMTTPEMAEAPPEGFSPELIEDFFRRGRKLYEGHIRPLAEGLAAGSRLVEYGCGAGRILKFVAEAGFEPVGIDISPTMLERCRELVPEVRSLHLLDEAGRCDLADATAALVFSYSVLQHISLLSAYETALSEMCRLVRPGGGLALQLNCYDYRAGDPATPWRTENFETHSLHYRPGEKRVYKRHDQDHWSGVYIGYDRLGELLAAHGVTIERWYFHNPAKPWAIWIVARRT